MCSGQLCLLIDADPSEVPTFPQTLGDRAAIYLHNYIQRDSSSSLKNTFLGYKIFISQGVRESLYKYKFYSLEENCLELTQANGIFKTILVSKKD